MPGMRGTPARLSSQEQFLLPLLNDPCLIRAVLLTSQINVLPGAQVSLAESFLGSRLLLDAQAPSIRAIAKIARCVRIAIVSPPDSLQIQAASVGAAAAPCASFDTGAV
jgi:hypothetical protein